MEYNEIYKTIPYTIKYNELFNNWEWEYYVILGEGTIRNSGTSCSTKSDAQREAEWSIDQELKYL